MSLAVAKRLMAAGLMPIAERVAAEREIPVAALLGVTGRVSPAQADLFRALSASLLPAEIAAMLGWGETAVLRALGLPDARPTPVPESGERAVKPPEPLPAAKRKPTPLEIKVDGIDKRLRNMSRIGERVRRLSYDLALARKEIEALRSEVAECRATVAAASPTAILDSADREAERHLARFPDAVDIVRAAAVDRGVRVHEILSGKAARGHENKAIGDARRSVIKTLTVEFRWSQPQIAALLRMDPSTIYHWQGALGISTAGKFRRPKVRKVRTGVGAKYPDEAVLAACIEIRQGADAGEVAKRCDIPRKFLRRVLRGEKRAHLFAMLTSEPRKEAA